MKNSNKNLILFFCFFFLIGSVSLAQVSNDFTPLHKAVKDNDISLVKSLIAQNADINKEVGSGGFTPLAVAVMKQNYDMVKVLLVHKADINKQSDEGATVLHLAIKEGSNMKIITLLMAFGANPNLMVTSEGISPLMLVGIN